MVHGPLFAAGTLHHIDDEVAGRVREGVEVIFLCAGEADDAAGDEDPLEIGAALKGTESDFNNALRQDEVREAGAVLEGVGIQSGGAAAGEVHPLQTAAAQEKTIPQSADPVEEGHIREAGAGFKETAAHTANSGGDGDIGEAGLLKGVAAQLGAGGGNFNVSQVSGFAETAGPELVYSFAVDSLGNGIGRGGIAAGIGDKCQILILILRFAFLHPGAEHHAVLGEVVLVVRVHFDLRHAAAALEDVAGDILGNGGDDALRQLGAVDEGGDPDGELSAVLGIGKEDLLQVGAALKGAVADFLDATRDGDGSNFFVPLESFARNGGDGIGDDDVAAGAIVAHQHTVLNVGADEIVIFLIGSVGTGDHGKDHAQAQKERGKAAPEGLNRIIHAVPPI